MTIAPFIGISRLRMKELCLIFLSFASKNVLQTKRTRRCCHSAKNQVSCLLLEAIGGYIPLRPFLFSVRFSLAKLA